MDKAKLRITGYGKLQEFYNLDVLPHYCVSYIAMKGERRTIVEPLLTTEIYPLRYEPGDLPGALIEFALKYEGVNLEILYSIFQKMEEKEICRHILASPLGIYTRKIWFQRIRPMTALPPRIHGRLPRTSADNPPGSQYP